MVGFFGVAGAPVSPVVSFRNKRQQDLGVHEKTLLQQTNFTLHTYGMFLIY